MLTKVLDLLFPQKSLTGMTDAFVTDEEYDALHADISIETAPELQKRGLSSIDALIAISNYHASPLLKKAIRLFKYNRIPALQEALGNFFVEHIPQEHIPSSAVLCPVPLHWTRLFQRGFNQSHLLAEHIAQKYDIPLEELLRRKKATGHQAWRSREQRLKALENAFEIGKNYTASHVILIDDVSTTGSTLNQCAKTLKSNGVQRVDAWVLAHG